MQKLWEQGVRPTAVVCACDNSALGIYRFLYEKAYVARRMFTLRPPVILPLCSRDWI